MRKAKLLLFCLAASVLAAGCSGISTVNFSRYDKGRKVATIAIIAHNYSVADRYQMWAWTKKQPHVVPKDVFDEQIIASLSGKTDCKILPPEVVRDALEKLNLTERPHLSRQELLAFREATGADAVLFADVSFYLQNYLFYKTFGLVEITMRLIGTPDRRLLWEAKGRNFALFITTDSALTKVREKMIVQLAQKLAQDKPMSL
ncbi:MAG: hypothetical protein NTZ78_11835 [Candidatus Aureabacteria bacterium]|nr:hypothetical protein [Candidatus Auribacterota bacterium]